MPISGFIQALQATKKELTLPERLDFEARKQAALKFAQLLREAAFGTDASLTSQLQDPYQNLFSTEFYTENILQPAIKAFEDVSTVQEEANTFTTGLLSMRLRSPFFLRLAAERLAPALAAGNVLIWEVRAEEKPLAQYIKELLSQAGFPSDSLQVIVSCEAIDELMQGHPGIRGVTWFDPSFEPKTASWFEKKWQVHRGGKGTALVLADANLEEAAKGIVKSIREAWGTTSWNISRVFVLDSIEKDFLAAFEKALSEVKETCPPEIAAMRDEWVRKFTQDQARVMKIESPISVLQNISNCTDGHQTEMQSPVVFQMSVKYPHEMAKWINNIPNAMGVQIWGSKEKAAKLAAKLECGRIWHQGWVEQDPHLFYGVKSSVVGDLSQQIFGAFYSERKVFDVAVKNPSVN